MTVAKSVELQQHTLDQGASALHPNADRGGRVFAVELHGELSCGG